MMWLIGTLAGPIVFTLGRLYDFGQEKCTDPWPLVVTILVSAGQPIREPRINSFEVLLKIRLRAGSQIRQICYDPGLELNHFCFAPEELFYVRTIHRPCS